MVQPILFVGDMHLGRTPHRLAAAGLDPTKLGPAEAWRRVVRFAVDHGVQAVVLAGDVVDQEKDRFEAFAHLQRGVTTLLDAGIGVMGVAGNHDAIALPKLAKRIEDFVLLGVGGRWQRVELDGVDLIGWSFPARHHRDDPILAPDLPAVLQSLRPDTLSLGVLHTDLDGGQSPYAPTTRRGLNQLSLGGWFLGHVHQPSALSEQQTTGYLGSLVGLDRGEPGPRGPWLITPVTASEMRVKQVPLGPVLWRDVTIDVSGLLLTGTAADARDDALHTALHSALTQAARDDAWFQAGDFDAVGCSVRFEGRNAATAAIRRFVAQQRAHELRFQVAGVPWVVVAMREAVAPVHDLNALAQEASPVGQVAALLLALRANGAAAIPEDVGRNGFDATRWLVDSSDAPLADPVAATRTAAITLLERLLAQRGRDAAGGL